MNEMPSLNDPRLRRKLLARCHPDAGGEHELFVWASHLCDEVDAALRRAETMQGQPQRPVHVYYSRPTTTTTTTEWRVS
jgi:hypothetical protein